MKSNFRRGAVRTVIWIMCLTSACIAGCGHNPEAENSGDTDVADTNAGTDADAGADANVGADADAGADNDTDADTNVGHGTCESPLWIDEQGQEVDPGVWVVEGDHGAGDSAYEGSCSEEHGPEVVFAFIPSQNGWLEVTLESRIGSHDVDPVLYVRSRCDDPVSELNCNDDMVALNSSVYIDALAGETYYIFADSYGDDSFGPFTLTVDTAPKPSLSLPLGYWRSRGYGLGLVVEEANAIMVELTSAVPSCIKHIEGPHSAIARLIREVREISDDRIEVDIRSATTTITFDRLDEIPAACADGLTPLPEDEGYSRDPELVFEVFVETFYEHYAFFDLREVDWDAVVAEGRAAVSADTSDEELFDIMGDMIRPLADVHVSLESPFRELQSTEPPAIIQFQEELDAAGGGDLEEYTGAELERYYRNIDGYLLEPASGDNDPLAFGLIAEDLGYLRITHFGMEGTELEENLEILRTVLAAAADIPTLIMDLRINGGGCDTAAHAIASLFAAERTPVCQKSARFDGGETEPYTVYLEPDQIYDGRILLLTNENAGSSGEIFVLIMRALPQVTLIGRSTMGILSDIMDRTLPNGWSVGLSNEIYRTMEGDLFERVGIPPDVPIEAPLFSLEDRSAGVDRGLEFVLSWIDDNPI